MRRRTFGRHRDREEELGQAVDGLSAVERQGFRRVTIILLLGEPYPPPRLTRVAIWTKTTSALTAASCRNPNQSSPTALRHLAAARRRPTEERRPMNGAELPARPHLRRASRVAPDMCTPEHVRHDRREIPVLLAGTARSVSRRLRAVPPAEPRALANMPVRRPRGRTDGSLRS